MHKVGTLVLMLLIEACSGRASGPQTSQTSGLTERAGDAGSGGERTSPPPLDEGSRPPGVQEGTLSSPPPPSAEEIAHAQQCSVLQDDATRAFSEGLPDVDVVQCSIDADCEHIAFYSHDDGCWASCGVERGTSEYGEALKSLVVDPCESFFEAGCTVIPVGCPPLRPPVLVCVDAKCELADD